MKELDLIKKKRILIVTISIGLLLTILIGAAVAYMAPKINGTEASSTIVFNSGTVAIVYENGENQINAKDVLPGWTAIKEFSLTAKNNTSLDSGDAMSYGLKLVVEKNTFSDGAITYSIEGENTNNNGTVADVLPNTLKSGTSKVSLGYGTFDTSGDIENGVVHNYTLTLAFPNKTYTNQNGDMGKQLSAYITIEKPGELANLTIIDGQHNINKTVKFEKNTTYELPNQEPKNNMIFTSWAVDSGSGVISGNTLTITGDTTIKSSYSEKIIEYAYTAPTTSVAVPYYTYVAPTSATYLLETWGAQGGGVDAGYGAYSTGKISLNKGDTLYVYVGGQGGKTTGGYNGGGAGSAPTNNKYTDAGAGGGATHIATTSGLLSALSAKISNILIVSGAGGGSAGWTSNYTVYSAGGSAGGILGNSGILGTNSQSSGAYTLPTGGSQTAGGTKSTGTEASGSAGSFGKGGASGNRAYGGGGAGYYGGGGGGSSFYTSLSGAGGSSYIGNSLLTNKSMYCYNCEESNDESTKTISTTCHNASPTANCAKEGNGYARITLIDDSDIKEMSLITIVNEELKKVTTVETQKGMEIVLSPEINAELEFAGYELERGTATIDGTKITPNSDKVVLIAKYKMKSVYEYDFIASDDDNIEPYYTFTAPVAGTYKLEAWGAQGGGTGGTGGYSFGTINLNQNDSLYVYVGGAGSGITGGYNGGGTALTKGFGGGGATHIATSIGKLSALSSSLNNIIIVAGGGGGKGKSGAGGNAGGFSGNTGADGACSTKGGGGATQTAGGACVSAGSTYCLDGSFGIGGNGKGGNNGGAGGGGYYGGASGTGGDCYGGGGGGSSYIGNPLLTNKVMYCYNCTESSAETTKTISTTCHSETPTSNCAKDGNGYARITLIS